MLLDLPDAFDTDQELNEIYAQLKIGLQGVRLTPFYPSRWRWNAFLLCHHGVPLGLLNGIPLEALTGHPITVTTVDLPF